VPNQDKTKVPRIENTENAELFIEMIKSIIKETEPGRLIRKVVKRRGDILTIIDSGKTLSYNLSDFRRIIVIGAGKASGRMATAIEEILCNRLDYGVVNVLHEQTFNSSKIKFIHAAHPLPDREGMRGVKEMFKLIGNVNADDLFICLMSGGASAMIELPADNISLEDSVKLTKLLLESGADINEINCVRKHISAIKGGFLAARLYPATVISLILSDVVGNKVDTIASGPTSPDFSTFIDAKDVLVKHNLWSETPLAIRTRIERGIRGEVEETPKPGDHLFLKVKNIIVGSNEIATEAARKFLISEGFTVHSFSRSMTGEARLMGMLFAKELINRATSKKFAIIAGGETTVTLGKVYGKGGRNQELALSAALSIQGFTDLSMISFATDGLDGPTDAAGAFVDGSTVLKAKRAGIDPEEYLLKHNSYNFFKKVGGLIITGATGTNVNDVAIGVKN
jgi:glycerate-2-kinase